MQLVWESILVCVKLKGVIFKRSCLYATGFSHLKCHGQEIQKMQHYEQYTQESKRMPLLNILLSSISLNSGSSLCKYFYLYLQVHCITKHYVQFKTGPKQLYLLVKFLAKHRALLSVFMFIFKGNLLISMK